MLSGWRLAALLQKVADALADVAHPLGLLGGGGGVDGKGLGGCLDEPAVTQLPLVRHRVDGDALQRNDVLLVVLLFLDDDVAVYQDVVEEEELARLGLLAAQLGEHALADEHAAWDGERLTCRAEAALHYPDALGVGLAVRQPVHHLSLA